MIKILYDEGTYGAVVICDHCKQRIKDAELAAAVSTVRNMKDGDLADIVHAHKGQCHDALEQKYSAGDNTVGWDELSHHLIQLVLNTGVTLDRLKEQQKTLQRSGLM